MLFSRRICIYIVYSHVFLVILLSTPMGVDHVVIGFDMEVQPLVTHNAVWPLCVSAVCIDVVSNHLL